MIPVEQTIFTVPEGNCYVACLASVLELNLEQVPNFMHVDGKAYNEWFEKYQEWLGQYGYYQVNLPVEGMEDNIKAWLPSTAWGLLAAESPRHPGTLHSVVIQGPRIVWDPHPLRNMGVGRWKEITLLVPLSPKLDKNYVSMNQLLKSLEFKPNPIITS